MLKFFKILQTTEKEDFYKINYDEYLSSTVLPLFRNHFQKKTKIKNQKQYETTLNQQLTKLEKELVPALYEKYAGIFMGFR